MTYYDPWLALYLNGPSGEQAATSSLAVLHQLNSELRSSYKAYSARIAAVQKAFDLGHGSHGLVQRPDFATGRGQHL